MNAELSDYKSGALTTRTRLLFSSIQMYLQCDAPYRGHSRGHSTTYFQKVSHQDAKPQMRCLVESTKSLVIRRPATGLFHQKSGKKIVVKAILNPKRPDHSVGRYIGGQCNGIYERSYMNCGERYEFKIDHRL